MLLCCVQHSGLRGLEGYMAIWLYNEVSVYIFVDVIGVGDSENKPPKITESVFRFRLFWATENGFCCEKPAQAQGMNMDGS